MRIRFKFIAFCIVGAGAFLVDWIFFNIFYYLVQINYLSSLAIGVIVSMIFNFIVNRNFTFGASGHPIKRQIFRWTIVYAFGFLVRVIVGEGILFIFEEDNLTAQIAYFAGIGLSIPLDFLGSLFWAFKKR